MVCQAENVMANEVAEALEAEAVEKQHPIETKGEK